MSIVGRGIYLGGGDGGATLNIDYGATPPVDTSKLWVPLDEKPVSVEINGEKMSYGQNSLEPWEDGDPVVDETGSRWITDFAARVGDYIYVLGRTSNGSTNSGIYRFNPADGTFELRLSTSGYPTAHYAACVIGTCIYFSSPAYTDTTLYRYDTEANTWGAWMTIPDISFSTLVAYNGYIYKFVSAGGSSSTSTCHKIDVVNKTYTTIASLPRYYGRPWVWVYEGKMWIFIVPANSSIYYLYSYDPDADAYTLEKSGGQGDFGLNNVSKTVYGDYGTYGAESPLPVIGSSVYFLQYRGNSSYLNSAPYVLDMETLTFTEAPSVVDTGYYAARYEGFALYDMSMYMFGGVLYTSNTYEDTGSKYEYYFKIRRYRVETDLEAGHLKVFTDMTKRQTALINEDNCQLYAAVNGAYIGNADNYAREVDAYLYDTTDSQWKTLGGVAYTE